jgi:transposase
MNICGVHGCQRRFKTLYNLEKHRKLHDTIGKYECEECGKRFIELSSLSNHRRRHRVNNSQSLRKKLVVKKTIERKTEVCM